MEEQSIGTVISTLTGPSPSAVDFVVTTGTVHRGQYVEIDHSGGKLIGLVTDVIKTNRYFERAESVKEFEHSGTQLFEQFPTSEWEYLVANTKPLGIFTPIGIQRTNFPPSPGSKVRIVDSVTLKEFLRFNPDGLQLGEIERHSVPVTPSVNSLLKKHLAILAMSGFGKSHFVSCLIEELLDRKPEQGRIATIVLDTHGEYTNFAMKPDGNSKDYSTKTKIVRARDMKIGVPQLSVGMLANIIPGLSGPQKRELSRILIMLNREMKEGMGPYGLEELQQALFEDSGINESTKNALVAWISNLRELHLFGKTDNPSVFDVIQPGHVTIVDLSDLIDVRKKQIIVSYFAQKLFFERRKKSIPPFLLVLEEAHQYIPEKAPSDHSIARSIMRTIAREGRKFGASLCLVSQRPIQLDTTTLSQCSTNVILRISNPYDLDHIGKSAEALDRGSLDMITSLRVGEALLVGEAVSNPVFFKVRQRKSIPSIHEETLEDAAKSFEEGKKQEEKDVEEYL